MQFWAGKEYSSPVARQACNFGPARGTLPPFRGKHAIFFRQGVLFRHFKADMQLWAGKGYSSPVSWQVYNFQPARGTLSPFRGRHAIVSRQGIPFHLPPFHGKDTIFSRQGVLFPRFEAIVRFSGETFGGDPVYDHGDLCVGSGRFRSRRSEAGVLRPISLRYAAGPS